ncbi:DUF4268 domain-containing protein [Gemmatimonadota bacterium]
MLAERQVLYEKFWTGLLDRARKRTKLHANISPSRYHWVGTSSGFRGIGYNYVVTKEAAAIDLYIDRGKECKDENEAIFDRLLEHKGEIEEAYGDKLHWERLDAKRACRISERFDTGGYRASEKEWPTIQDAMIDAMIRMEESIAPHIAKLDSGG